MDLPGDGTVVFNLATQHLPGRDARLEWVVTAAELMAKHATSYGLPEIATVRLGCGIGGLDWADVRPALEAIETDLHLFVAVPNLTQEPTK
jgi:O-acetyl-ADP-ribose deacetylase (regulator of RNase III)